MTFNPQPLIRLAGSRSFAVALVIISVAATVAGAFGFASAAPAAIADRGFGLPSPAEWFASPEVSLWVNLAAEFAALAGIWLVNRAFNLFRGLHGGATLMSGLFMFMQGASGASQRFTGGIVLVLLVLAAVATFYSIYQQHDGNRRIFMIFALFGAATLTQYGFAPYLAVLVIGVVQMRVMSPRAVIALLAGTVTPLWILWGSGLMELHPLQRDLFTVPFTDTGEFLTDIIPAAAALMSLLTGFAAGLLDMVQIYARNAMTRARFGLLAVTATVTGLLCILDFGNIAFYLPLLNLTTAFFVTLLFSLRPRGAMGAGTVTVVIVTLLSAALYIWRTVSVLV